jgi:hypothetical protein
MILSQYANADSLTESLNTVHRTTRRQTKIVWEYTIRPTVKLSLKSRILIFRDWNARTDPDISKTQFHPIARNFQNRPSDAQNDVAVSTVPTSSDSLAAFSVREYDLCGTGGSTTVHTMRNATTTKLMIATV